MHALVTSLYARFRDSWLHLCTVGPTRIDPTGALGSLNATSCLNEIRRVIDTPATAGVSIISATQRAAAEAGATGACEPTLETSSSDLPLVSGAMSRQMTNATAVRIAPNSMVVPVPSAEMLSGNR